LYIIVAAASAAKYVEPLEIMSFKTEKEGSEAHP
jgi:hypothetical protein